MKKLLSWILAAAMMLSLSVTYNLAAAETAELIATANATYQNGNQGPYTGANLRIKNQTGATERVSLIKFDYSAYDVDAYGTIELNLYPLETSGVGHDEMNKIRLYWSADTDWTEGNKEIKNYTSIAAISAKTEIGDTLIQIPNTQKAGSVRYWSYDVTQAVRANKAAGKTEISFILQQDKGAAGSTGGIDFASRTNAGKEPKLVFSGENIPDEPTEENVVYVGDNITLQSDNKALGENLLMVKHQDKATERVILLKFDYSKIDTKKYAKAMLGVYAVYRNSGTGKDDPNRIAVYWSPDIDGWNSSTTAWSALPKNVTEVGDNLITLPAAGGSTDPNLNKYYEYDISSAIALNTNPNKQITIMIRQKVYSGSSGGYAFANGSDKTKAPKLTFLEGALLPSSPIANGEVVAAVADATISAADADENFGADNSLVISQADDKKALLKFDLSDYSADDIAGAGLRMYLSDTDSYVNQLYKISAVPQNWTEAAVTYNNAPSDAKASVDYVLDVRKGTGYFADIDVTELVKNTSDLSAFSVLIEQISAGDGSTFNSKENADGSLYAPHMVIRTSNTGSIAKTAKVEVCDDAYVRFDNTSSVDYQIQNFGSEDLMVKMNANADRKAFIKFDFSDTDVDYKNTRAELQLYYKPKSGTGADANTVIEVYYCPDSNWEESELTAATALSMTENAYKAEHLVGRYTLGLANGNSGYKSIDISEFIRKHIDDFYNRNITFMLMQTNVAGSNGGATFASRENAYPATVVLYPNIPTGYAAKPIAADAHVRFGSYKDTAYGTADTLDVKNYKDAASVRELYIKADISDCIDFDGSRAVLLLPVKAQNIGTAHLKVYGAMYLFDYTDTWSETTLTANNVERYISDMTYVTDFEVKKTSAGSYVQVDVTDFVTEAAEYGIDEVTFKIVEDDDPNDVNNLTQFYSKESMYAPMLAYTTENAIVGIGNYTETKTSGGINVSAVIKAGAGSLKDGYITNSSSEVSVIAAGYDANDVLTDVTVENITANEYGYEYSKTIEGAERVKLMVWDELNAMTPRETVDYEDESAKPLAENYYDDADVGAYNEERSAELAADTKDYLAGNEKIVVAALMENQRTMFYSGAWRHWNNSGNSAKIPYVHYPTIIKEDGRRDIAASSYPSIGLYDVSDPDYVDYQLQLMKMAGVDAVSLNIRAYNDDLWRINNVKNVIAPMLEKYGIKGFARIDSYKSFDFTDENMTDLINMFGDAILKINGRPVISVFENPGDRDNITTGWRNVYKAQYGTDPFIMSWGQSSVQNLGNYDGIYSWVNSWQSDREARDGYDAYYTAQQAKQNYVLLTDEIKSYVNNSDTDTLNYIADAVAPAFDNKPVEGWGGTKSIVKIEEGENSELYKYRWTNAVANNFPMVMIATWDDWSEGTQIMPSLENGNRNLIITRHYTAEYKGNAEDMTADFNISDWIYKIRKTTDDANILAVMEKACEYMADGNYTAAKQLVRPYAFEMKIPNVTTRFSY